MFSYHRPLLALTAASLVILGDSALAHSHAEGSPKRAPDAIPFSCTTNPWDSSFTVVKASYNKEARKLIWILTANADLKVPTYEVEVKNGEGVKMAIIRVEIIAPGGKVKAGKQVRAVVPLGILDVSEIAYLVLSEVRK